MSSRPYRDISGSEDSEDSIDRLPNKAGRRHDDGDSSSSLTEEGEAALSSPKRSASPQSNASAMGTTGQSRHSRTASRTGSIASNVSRASHAGSSRGSAITGGAATNKRALPPRMSSTETSSTTTTDDDSTDSESESTSKHDLYDGPVDLEKGLRPKSKSSASSSSRRRGGAAVATGAGGAMGWIMRSIPKGPPSNVSMATASSVPGSAAAVAPTPKPKKSKLAPKSKNDKKGSYNLVAGSGAPRGGLPSAAVDDDEDEGKKGCISKKIMLIIAAAIIILIIVLAGIYFVHRSKSSKAGGESEADASDSDDKDLSNSTDTGDWSMTGEGFGTASEFASGSISMTGAFGSATMMGGTDSAAATALPTVLGLSSMMVADDSSGGFAVSPVQQSSSANNGQWQVPSATTTTSAAALWQTSAAQYQGQGQPSQYPFSDQQQPSGQYQSQGQGQGQFGQYSAQNQPSQLAGQYQGMSQQPGQFPGQQSQVFGQQSQTPGQQQDGGSGTPLSMTYGQPEQQPQQPQQPQQNSGLGAPIISQTSGLPTIGGAMPSAGVVAGGQWQQPGQQQQQQQQPWSPTSSALPAMSTGVAPQGKTYQTKATWYQSSQHLTQCETVVLDTDYVVALQSTLYGGNDTVSGFCGKKLTVYNPSTRLSVEVLVSDNCPNCPNEFALDLSKAAFAAISDLSIGLTDAIWWWSDPSTDALMANVVPQQQTQQLSSQQQQQAQLQQPTGQAQGDDSDDYQK